MSASCEAAQAIGDSKTPQAYADRVSTRPSIGIDLLWTDDSPVVAIRSIVASNDSNSMITSLAFYWRRLPCVQHVPYWPFNVPDKGRKSPRLANTGCCRQENRHAQGSI